MTTLVADLDGSAALRAEMHTTQVRARDTAPACWFAGLDPWATPAPKAPDAPTGEA